MTKNLLKVKQNYNKINMVVGNGLIASAFSEYRNDESILIFASGVSNSKESRKEEFEREKNLLLSFKNKQSKFVYFSTCSVFDTSLASTSYIKHKKDIEKRIVHNFDTYLIIRLPIVVSRSPNPNTLTNYLYNKIVRDVSFELYQNAYRYLMDIEDVKTYVNMILKYDTNLKLHDRMVNLAFSNKINILELVRTFEKVLNKKASFIRSNKGSDYTIKDTVFDLICREKKPVTRPDYIYNLIDKYYSEV